MSQKRFVSMMTNSTAISLRPSPTLQNAVFLWGIHLSKKPSLASLEPAFLKRTLRSLHIALSAGSQSQNVMDILQTEILLSYYFFHQNRILEGQYHANAAVSLAYMTNLHKVMSEYFLQGVEDFVPPGQVVLPSPANATDESERIYAWWTTFILNKSMMTSLSTPPLSHGTWEPQGVIDTPWPQSWNTYEEVRLCHFKLRFMLICIV